MKEIAYCGLYCEACSFRLAALERDKAHLMSLPARYDKAKVLPIEELELCDGCKQEDNAGYCKIKDCVRGKGLSTCADCPDMSCDILSVFCADGTPHHDTSENLKRIREIGEEAWVQEQAQKYTCDCGKRLSWYTDQCSECRG